LPLLVQLPDLRAQGAFNQYVYLSALCHELALRDLCKKSNNKRASTIQSRLFCVLTSEGLRIFIVDFVFVAGFIILPHGEVTGTGKSGLHSEMRQNPTVENVPRSKDTNKNQYRLHKLPLY
jgi:hypothetical protein